MRAAGRAARIACSVAFLLFFSPIAAAQDRGPGGGPTRVPGPPAAPPAGEPAPELSPAAQALFEQAVKLMDAGAFAEACPKLKEVVRSYPSGVGGRLRLAECHVGEGRLASAWVAYRSAEAAAALAGQAAREQKARERAAALAPRLSNLTLVVPAALLQAPELAIRLDERDVGPAEWGIPIPSDGGRHTVRASAREKAPWQVEIDLAPEGARASVTVVLVDTPPGAPVSGTGAEGRPASPPQAAPGSASRPVPAWVWLTGGSGLGLLIAGAALRIDVQVIHAAQEARCKGDLQHCARADPGYDPSADDARKNLEFGLFVGLTVSGALAAGASVVGLVATRSRAAPAAARFNLAPWIAGASRGATMSVSF